jgi:peroxiredoxin
MQRGRWSAVQWVWPACVLVLTATNLFLLKEVRRLRGEVWYEGPGANRQAVISALDTPLPNLEGVSLVMSKTAYRYLLLFFFKPGDCKPCLQQLTELNDVETVRPDVGVFAIAGDCSLDEAKQIQRFYMPHYPILLDEGGGLIRSLGVRQTPWKVAIERETRRIVFNDPGSQTFAQRQAFLDRAYHIQ